MVRVAGLLDADGPGAVPMSTSGRLLVDMMMMIMNRRILPTFNLNN